MGPLCVKDYPHITSTLMISYQEVTHKEGGCMTSILQILETGLGLENLRISYSDGAITYILFTPLIAGPFLLFSRQSSLVRAAGGKQA